MITSDDKYFLRNIITHLETINLDNINIINLIELKLYVSKLAEIISRLDEIQNAKD